MKTANEVCRTLATLLVVAACTSRPSSAPSSQVSQPKARPELKGLTLDDYAQSSISILLRPDADAPAEVLVLEVKNTSTTPVDVTRFALLQVGQISKNGQTVASQDLSDAVFVNWLLQPGERKEWRFDLRKIVFETIDGSTRGPALDLASKIPSGDRQFSVGVLYKSSRWPSGMEDIANYP
jgi:hypothetical protein